MIPLWAPRGEGHQIYFVLGLLLLGECFPAQTCGMAGAGGAQDGAARGRVGGGQEQGQRWSFGPQGRAELLGMAGQR